MNVLNLLGLDKNKRKEEVSYTPLLSLPGKPKVSKYMRLLLNGEARKGKTKRKRRRRNKLAVKSKKVNRGN